MRHPYIPTGRPERLLIRLAPRDAGSISRHAEQDSGSLRNPAIQLIECFARLVVRRDEQPLSPPEINSGSR